MFTRLACDIRQNCARRAIWLSRHGDRDGLITVSIAMQAPNVNQSRSASY
jgi:hypothetical protein